MTASPFKRILWEPGPSRQGPFFSRLKGLLIGSPIPSARERQERVSVFVGLGAFASDAISSVAYATEEMLLVLVAFGAAAVAWGPAISGMIAALLAVVLISYYQTVHAYPAGGGAYNVARDNLGVYPALVAGAALVVDYILTVAVSVAAGIDAITSAAPALHEHRVALAIAAVVLLTLGNLRGVREAGWYFALPTYLFILSVLWLVGAGAMQLAEQGSTVSGGVAPTVSSETASVIGLWVIIRAFSAGSVALTGVEAIANAVPAFRDPAPRQAGIALICLGVILGTLFAGITVLTFGFGISPRPGETVLSQLGSAVFGSTLPYALLQTTTALVLLLAANTSFAGFPRLASLLGRDRFLPRQLAQLGDRLVFSNGIVILGVVAALLLVIFDADTHALIPLYAVGVFLAFTISQTGMVLRWHRRQGHGWRWRAVVSGIGALATGTVLLVIASAKFTHGAWMVLVVIPLLVWMFVSIHRHYEDAERQLRVDFTRPPHGFNHTVVVPISGINQPVLMALQYARSLSPRVRAVYVSLDAADTKQMQALWEQWNPGIDLVILEPSHPTVVTPLLEYVDVVKKERDNDLVTVVLPEFVPKRWWHHVLHNQTALLLKGALLFRKDVVVTDVRYHLDR
ncbi:MAG: APC family permease [Nitrospirae bacterium]|nr:APC family permease [Nitrospirota bacterium]